MIKWRSPAVIVTAVAAVVGGVFLFISDRDRRAAEAECRTEEAGEECKEQSGRSAHGGFVAVPGVLGRTTPRVMTGQPDPMNPAAAANAADAQNQNQTQRSGFGATGRSRGFSGG